MPGKISLRKIRHGYTRLNITRCSSDIPDENKSSSDECLPFYGRTFPYCSVPIPRLQHRDERNLSHTAKLPITSFVRINAWVGVVDRVLVKGARKVIFSGRSCL